MSTWMITGCSSGLGKALALHLLERGDNVVVTARQPGALTELMEHYPNTVLVLALNVTNHEQIVTTVRRATEHFGAIDVLVNNAGYGYRAAVEEADPADLERLFATNFFGAVALIQEVLPGMRERRHGTVVNISSIGARMSPAGSGFYSASKAALEAMTASLRREVTPLGIRAIVVEPGAFRTDFAGRSLTQSATAIGDYAESAGRRRKENDNTHGTQIGDPDKAAAAIAHAVQSGEPPFMLVLGSDAVSAFRESLATLEAELDSWELLSETTDFKV
jgi:NAD(P)-dependent dehydrogenase (short-subunit alcohol dehydrogenase family)